MKTVAIITSTIGRPHLERAILSVQKQTYPCKHYVFVDGEQFAADAKRILDKYPDVVATYLPMNTGANGWTNSSINAIAPFLVKEDVICYLDDDNWYEPNHVENSLNVLNETKADYVFALRNLYSDEEEFVCEDLLESIGHYENNLPNPYKFNVTINNKTFSCQTVVHKKDGHIDTNCYMIKRDMALRVSRFWYSGKHNDTNFYAALKQIEAVGKCSKAFTVNYFIEPEKWDPGFFETVKSMAPGMPKEIMVQLFKEMFRMKMRQVITRNDGKYPWDKDE
nr:glycosyltransferase family A protein [uncultured Haemophilus sp.]